MLTTVLEKGTISISLYEGLYELSFVVLEFEFFIYDTLAQRNFFK